MSTVLAPIVQNKQAVMPKSMVSDPEWFDGDKQNLKTGGEKSNYSSRGIELQQQMIESLQS